MRMVLVAMLAAVFVMKVALALTLAGHPLLQPAGDLDSGEYWRLAERVAAGDLLLDSTSLHVSPLYIYWLALAQAATGGSIAGVLVLQAVAGTTAVWLAGRTAAAWMASVAAPAPRVAAIAAGAALALTGIIALQEALILQSGIDPILMAIFALAATRAVQVPTPLRWVASGSALALLAMNRPNAWLLAVPCGLSIVLLTRGSDSGDARMRWRSIGMWLLGVGLVLAPFAARTAIATGEWQPLPVHGGLNAYIGNHPGANGTYTVVEGIRPSMAGQREDMRLVAERAVGSPLSDGQVSRHFLRRAVDWWRHSPGAASRLLVYKLWLVTHAWELPVNVSYAWFREQVWLLGLLPLGAWVLIPIGLAVCVAGTVLVPPGHRAAWRNYRWLLPTYLASVALFFVVDRYRAPALVLCAIHVGLLAGWASDHESRDRTLQERGARLRIMIALCLALVIGVASFVPLPFQRGQADADTRMAVHAIGAGDDEQAQTWIARAVERHPAPGLTWMQAGLAWQARNDFTRAEAALREAYRLDPREAAVAFALGEVLITEGKGAEAIPLLEQAERGGVRPDRTQLDLALARWQAGDLSGARATLAQGVPPESLPLLRARALAAVEARRIDLAAWLLAEHRRYVDDDAEVAEALGLMTARLGDTMAAAMLLEQAAALDASRATARFNLAIVRVQQGRRAEAIALLREALRIEPTYVQAAGALRELLGEP